MSLILLKAISIIKKVPFHVLERDFFVILGLLNYNYDLSKE